MSFFTQKNSRNLAVLVSTAIALERRGTERHAACADTMKQRGLENAATLFVSLACTAHAHEAMLKQWAKDLGGCAPPVGRPDSPRLDHSWENPLDIEPPDLQLSTSYQILAAAVTGEGRAFRFFSHMAANVTDPDIAERIEMMAQSALKHAAMLRHERRLAYHDNRRGTLRVQLPEPGLIRNLNDLCYAASILEGEVAALMDTVARDRPAIGSLVAEARMLADTMAGECEAHEDVAAAFDGYRKLRREKELQVTPSVTPVAAAIGHVKQAFAFYDGIVREADDEATMLKAQDFSRLALKRIRALS